MGDNHLEREIVRLELPLGVVEIELDSGMLVVNESAGVC